MGLADRGLGDTQDRLAPTMVKGLRHGVDVAAGYGDTIAVTLEGHLYQWGVGRGKIPSRMVVGDGVDGAFVVRVAVGHSHSLAVTSMGRLLSWGGGDGGQLGHGRRDDEAVPREVAGAGVALCTPW